MKRIVPFLVATLITVVLSCDKSEKDKPVENPECSVFIYMAGNNSLSKYIDLNTKAMYKDLSTRKDKRNLIVFADKADDVPHMLRISPSGIETLVDYEELNSANASTLSMAIQYFTDNYKSKYNGLILWGHGTGWLPSSQQDYMVRKPIYTSMHSATRAFAYEHNKNEPDRKYMDLDDMVDAIPDSLFDFIAFDACYMANVEVAYALRKKTDYIIANCSEFDGNGYPYQDISNHLIDMNLSEVCSSFMDYYNSNPESVAFHMGDISLIRTADLDSLALCCKKIMTEYKESIPEIDISNIQYFDVYENHVFFDLEDFIVHLGTKKEYLDEFRLLLNKCVVYNNTTQYMFPNTNIEFEIKKHCGMSVYIPLRKYESSGLNQEYRKTEWYKATY